MVRVFAAMRDGVEIRTNNDGSWSDTSVKPAERIECIAVAETKPNRVFLGTFDEGILRSLDSGRTFDRIGVETIEPDALTSIAIDPNDVEHMLVGTEPSRLYRSRDGGETWHPVSGLTSVSSSSTWSFPPRPDTHHVRWLAFAPTDPERWYIGIEAGAFLVTPDAGETWIDRPTGSRYDNHWITTHPDAPDRVYAAAGDGYAESYDRGETWSYPQEGLDHRYVWSVAVDPADPDCRLVSSAAGARQAHSAGTADAYVYRRNGTDSWERLQGIPSGSGVTRAVLDRGQAAGAFYAVSNEGIYHSDDQGDTWEAVPGTWHQRYRTQAARGIAVVPIDTPR